MAYSIYMDGTKVGSLANEGFLTVKVAPGRHTLYARIDWLKSPGLTFDISENETITYAVSGFRNVNLLVIALFLVVLYNTLRFLFNVESTFLLLLLVPALVVVLYFLTLGREKYLSIAAERTPPAARAVAPPNKDLPT
ncbi:hypothetical protein [Telluribacter sp.]|uniref:hypothetical protein n=1 Tax=Telluribacter sp. TaxID=1978767 RepID=UPI002E11256E|nr:hypothetical protein [Telluribacter sp.]